jgi:RND family efflux transporter MFP subunit
MTPKKSPGPLIGGVLILLLAAGAAFWGITTRARDLSLVTRETGELSVPTVSLGAPERGASSEEIVLPGTIQPYAEASIYARTNGYLKRWQVDIGSHVRAGELLAEIDTPEIDQQLEQARADLATAAANAKLAQSTADRYRELIKTDSVAQQDVDNANGNLEAKQATVSSARFNVKRLEDLQSFKRLEAPFDGIVTARNVDVGALVGSNGGKELFHVAATNKLRVFVNVPQVYSRAARQGLSADLTLKEFEGRRFAGTLARTAQAIDVASRTLLTEVDVDNVKGELLPGAYADVHLKLPSSVPTLRIPATAVIFKAEGVQIATADPSGRVTIVPVTIGRDFGASVEIVGGLKGDEQIILNPPDALATGQIVRIAKAADR